MQKNTIPPTTTELDDTDLDAAVGGVSPSIEPNDGVRPKRKDGEDVGAVKDTVPGRERWIDDGGSTKI